MAEDSQAEDESDDHNDRPTNKGKLIVDATCAPADITYRTDLKLVNQAREKTEEIIDSMHAPLIGTRRNRQYCKTKGIRLSGPPLGRPKKVTEANAAQLKQQRQIHRQDELDRNVIEGKFGQGKRRFTLNRIMAKLARTSEAAIASRSS